MYRARVWMVLVPGKNLSAKAFRTVPKPDSSIVSPLLNALITSRILRLSSSAKSAHDK